MQVLAQCPSTTTRRLNHDDAFERRSDSRRVSAPTRGGRHRSTDRHDLHRDVKRQAPPTRRSPLDRDDRQPAPTQPAQGHERRPRASIRRHARRAADGRSSTQLDRASIATSPSARADRPRSRRQGRRARRRRRGQGRARRQEGRRRRPPTRAEARRRSRATGPPSVREPRAADDRRQPRPPAPTTATDAATDAGGRVADAVVGRRRPRRRGRRRRDRRDPVLYSRP